MSTLAQRLERAQVADFCRPLWRAAPIPEQHALMVRMEKLATERLASLKAELVAMANPKPKAAKPGRSEVRP